MNITLTSDMSSPTLLFQGTTPTFTFTLSDSIDLSTMDSVALTFCKPNYVEVLTKQDSDLTINNNSVSVFLDQDETLELPRGKTLVQLNWTYTEDQKTKRDCSDILTISVRRNLLNDTM